MAGDDEGPMKEWNRNALHSLQGELKCNVRMKAGLIDKLHKAAGGFMDHTEVQTVGNKSNDGEQMEELLRILHGKRNADFKIFCTMLRKSNYGLWAVELERKAGEFKEQFEKTKTKLARTEAEKRQKEQKLKQQVATVEAELKQQKKEEEQRMKDITQRVASLEARFDQKEKEEQTPKDVTRRVHELQPMEKKTMKCAKCQGHFVHSSYFHSNVASLEAELKQQKEKEEQTLKDVTRRETAAEQPSEVQSSREKALGHLPEQLQRSSSGTRAKFVAAIDIGTCNTRMAFCFSKTSGSCLDDVIVMDAWEYSPGHDGMVPTTLLMDHTGKAMAYGYEAEETFSWPAEVKTPYLFKNFKMELHQRLVFSERHKLKAINGGEAPAIDVFSAALRYLADKLIEFISYKIQLGVVQPREIQWVLTVPAIWRPEARQFMRRAAYKAGLCTPSTRKRLIIALEPECAALYVRSLKEKHGEAYGSLQYGVVDCGGGTVDIAYHSVESREGGKFVVKELAPPSGGPYGGLLVDEAFEKLLEPVFGRGLSRPFFEQLKLKYTAAWLNLMRQLDEKKTRLDRKAADDRVWFDIPFEFNRACKQITGKDAFKLLSGSKADGITLSRQLMKMEVRSDLIKALYHPVVDAICCCLNADLGKCKLSNVSALYLVGGFSQSRYLLQSVRDKTRSGVPQHCIISPPACSMATVKGAVMYGINPAIVQERVAAMSYGFSVVQPFDATSHPKRKAVYYDGVKYCEDVYDEIVSYGHKVCNTDEPIVRRRSPVVSGQRSMCIEVYSAPHRIDFVDDPGCEHLANLVVDMPDTRGGRERNVFIEIEFDGPEIHVVATDANTGKSYDVSLEFMYV